MSKTDRFGWLRRRLLTLCACACWLAPRSAGADTTVRYLYNDALGTAVAAADERGALLWRKSHRPFGFEHNIEGNLVDAVASSRGFTGHRYDRSSGLVYQGKRFYNPELGIFYSVDPAPVVPGLPFSFNRYIYANQNPYRYVDPSGAYIESAIDAASLGLGIASIAAWDENTSGWEKALDIVGVAVDGAALAVPLIPGGAGIALKAFRGADKARDALRVADESRDLINGAELASDAARQGDRVKDVANGTCAGGRCGCFVAGTPVDTPDGPRAIETVELGARVGPATQTCERLRFDAWTEIQLRMLGDRPGASDEVEVRLLRPPGWLRDHRVAAGESIVLALDELNISGSAHVTHVGPARPLEPGDRCPVTGLVRRTSADLVRLELDTGRPLEVTEQHAVYSADRNGWVAAGALHAGERLRTHGGGFAEVRRATRLPPVLTEVFNLEIISEHRYFVGEQRVLVHNSYAAGGPRGALKRLHGASLDPRQLESMRRMSTEEIVESLATKGDEALRVRPDGTVLQGNHRIKILEERGFDTSKLWDSAEVIPKEPLGPLD